MTQSQLTGCENLPCLGCLLSHATASLPLFRVVALAYPDPATYTMTKTDRLWAAVLAILWCVALGAEQTAVYPVERVVDGDTVILATIGTVRLIGVDTPETVDPRKPVQRFGLESAAFLRSLLDGQSVRVEYDRQGLDKYRRTLAYLALLDGTSVNLEIVRQGYGYAYLNYPFDRMDAFRAAEREAREGKRGLWADAPPTGQAAAPATPLKVWVNTSSKVYHCSGARYYGTTARGEYMAEGEAVRKGHRPAGGKNCGPTNPAPRVATTPAQIIGPDANNAVGSDVRVWVNTSSRVYHCPGTRYYGATKAGQYMRQQDAQAAGHRPASGNTCR